MKGTVLRGYGFWFWLDDISHKLPLPKRWQAWLCDKADRSVGGE